MLRVLKMMAETPKNYTFVYKITRKKPLYLFDIGNIIRHILALMKAINYKCYVEINYNVKLAA